MGKAAKRDRRELARAQRAHHSELVVAERAQQAWDAAWGAAMDVVMHTLEQGRSVTAGRPVKLKRFEVHELTSVRARLMSTWSWPGHCWLPATLVTPGLVADLSLEVRDMAADLCLPPVSQLVGLAAWRNAPLVVRFDDDIAGALIDTPLQGEIPVDLLRRLPAPSLFLDMPWLGEGCGTWVSMDSSHHNGGVGVEDQDELILTTIDATGMAMVDYLRLDQTSVEASLAASRRDINATLVSLADQDKADAGCRERYGRSLAQLLAEVASLLLYLCSDEPDTARLALDRTITPRSTVAASAVAMTVLDVGVRLGAVLRAGNDTLVHPTTADDVEADGTGRAVRRPVAHMRRAHWHTYWTGPRSDPALRVAKLRWVHMIQVGADMPVTVRTAM